MAPDKEHSMSQNNLATLYENGEGVEKNLEKAVYWYNKSTEKGNEIAQYNLGSCYNRRER